MKNDQGRFHTLRHLRSCTNSPTNAQTWPVNQHLTGWNLLQIFAFVCPTWECSQILLYSCEILQRFYSMLTTNMDSSKADSERLQPVKVELKIMFSVVKKSVYLMCLFSPCYFCHNKKIFECYLLFFLGSHPLQWYSPGSVMFGSNWFVQCVFGSNHFIFLCPFIDRIVSCCFVQCLICIFCRVLSGSVFLCSMKLQGNLRCADERAANVSFTNKGRVS